ncbi:MAG: symmetrical bis(5'-nucleosyl)-tetraphosphatase [Thiotrichales bacterium]|nr:symmetrical bis(5'-nucleosyl)-tetraphosphatase [Thiotrichales bacterium]
MKNTYIIGDLQGCFDELQQLLQVIEYRPEQDELWFVGDLINRGPQSLECLRFVKEQCKAGHAKTVLGNHDFHLLAVYAGLDRFLSESDTLEPILRADDCDALVDWLRQQPLLIQHPQLDAVMVHAGIPPQWSLSQAKAYAAEAEQPLRADNWQTFVRDELFGNDDKKWTPKLSGWPRIRYIINAFARMRYCDQNGTLDFKLKGNPAHDLARLAEKKRQGFQPWYTFGDRATRDTQIFFGHWSTLGPLDGFNVHATDTGCLWGGQLTAYHLQSNRRICIECTQKLAPKLAKNQT